MIHMEQKGWLKVRWSRSVAWASHASACDCVTSWQGRSVWHSQDENATQKRLCARPLCLAYKVSVSTVRICRSPSAWDRCSGHAGVLPMQVFAGKPLIVHIDARSRVRSVHLRLLCIQFGPCSLSSPCSQFRTCRVHDLPIKGMKTR